MRPIPLLAVVLVALVHGAVPAARAETGHDACAGFIDSVPIRITTPGTWCMRASLVLAHDPSEWAAIQVETNHVTVDCNGFRLAGAAGGTVPEYGVNSYEHANVTIRRCDLRNFQYGISARGDNLVIEDNRIFGARSRGIYADSDNGLVRRNIVLETGHDTQFIGWAMGISAFGDVSVIDNTVAGVYATAGMNERAYGIFINSNDADTDTQVVAGNRVRAIEPSGTGQAVGIEMAGTGHAVIRDNVVHAPLASEGIDCPYGIDSQLSGNVVLGSLWPYGGCPDVSPDNIAKN